MDAASYSTYELSGLADCASPDRHDGIGFEPAAEPQEGSAGAKFLRHVAEDVAERLTDGIGDVHDEAHEVADNAVPIYTHELWTTFVDLAAYQEDPSELGAESDDLTKAAGVALYMIGNRLAVALFEEHEDDEDEEDE
jgi:hypothetical protein